MSLSAICWSAGLQFGLRHSDVVALGAGALLTYEQGFNVAIDAMTDLRPEAHGYSIANVFPRLGETGSTQAIVDLLETRSA